MCDALGVVTLDGPAGVGKTTVAKGLARALRVGYLDTGAMFRGVAWQLGDGAWDLAEEQLKTKLSGISFTLEGKGQDSFLLLNGAPLPEDIRNEEVGLWASNIARLQLVRDHLKALQRKIGKAVDLVAEGRDMGTVVFPGARHKFFLDASAEERARRRWLQLKSMGREVDLDQIVLTLKVRDEQDRNRTVAPLRPAEDAHIVDTTHLTLAEVLEHVLSRIV